MPDNDLNRTAKDEELREPEVTELDDKSLEEASGGSERGPIIVNNCDC